MNKQQINYVSNKIKSNIRNALNAMSAKHRDDVLAVLAAQLTKAGFTIKSDRYFSLLSYVYTDELKAMEAKLRAKYDATAEALRQKRDETMDILMLGDSKEALSILEKFNAELAELTK